VKKSGRWENRQPKWEIAKQSGRWETEIFVHIFLKVMLSQLLNTLQIINYGLVFANALLKSSKLII